MVAHPHRLSVEDYLELDRHSPDRRYEYIDGIVTTMLAGGTINHALIAANIIAVLHSLLRGTSCRVYTSDMRVSITATRYLYPDVSVSCDPHDQQQGNRDMIYHPRLVIEVLSPHTESYDRSGKFDQYRTCPTLQEYALVDTQREAIDLYRRQTENLWTFHPFRSGDEVELKSVNVRIPLATLYEHVVLP